MYKFLPTKGKPLPGYYRKILIAMKISFLLLIVPLLQVSALTTAQTITLSKINAPLREVFNEISSQTGYDFLYSKKQLSNSQRVNMSVKNVPIDVALAACFKDQPFTYVIQNKMIVIKDKESSFLDQAKSLITSVQKLIANIDVRGRIVDENNLPLIGANISIKGSNKTTKTDNKGDFLLESVDEKAVLLISFLGYETLELPASENLGMLKLVPATGKLQEVEVVSTGYQDIPKERATGSFTLINEKAINRSVGINIIDRLEGITSGLLLNRGLTGSGGNNAKISVHGRSTLFASVEPLIVLNGFPYDGTIDQINPGDIESINILKDAAASSIWGSRSGNGVVVITTKTGRRNQKLQISAMSTLTISAKQNLDYIPQLSSSDFVELEQYLFAKGLFTSRFSNPYNAVSTAVEIFNQRKNNKISVTDSMTRINELKAYDVRDDLNKYVYRHRVQQQYLLNLSGGTEVYKYYLSGGYDKNLESKVSDQYNRLTLNANNTFSLLKERLDIQTDLNFSSSKTYSGPVYNPYRPYDRLADDTGNSLATVDNFRMSYIDTAGNGNLLDWHYRPKDELQNADRIEQTDQYRIKFGFNYKLIDGLSVSASYQLLKETIDMENDNTVSSYYTRNLINQYSAVVSNNAVRVIPLGSIFITNSQALTSKTFRTQLNFNRVVAKHHSFNAIVGYEGSDSRSDRINETLYGYDAETRVNANGTINPLNNYKYYYNTSSDKIITAPVLSAFTNINQSFYTNASYIFKDRYIISGSARRDESNIFGVKTNQKGVPLWSAGFAWHITKESFYRFQYVPNLKLRMNFGYNGNVDRTVSAYLTATTRNSLPNVNSDLTAIIQNPPNPALRWEKIKTWNLGLDFAIKNNRVNGSLDFYQKDAYDLIGNNPIAFQSGVTQFRGNGANLRTKGADVIINSNNLIGILSWNTSLLFNYNIDKVTSYKVKQTSNSNLVLTNYDNPLEGYPYNAIFSYSSAGLDATGAPQGFLNGTISKDYAKIASILDPNQLVYHGSASPKYFGSFINSFVYKSFELSFNITYKFDYYFRRINVFGGSNYGPATNIVYNLADYDKRWKVPGDELHTNIPALAYPSVTARNAFFQNSEELIERGDHIRLQDIRMNWNFLSKKITNAGFKKANAFIYARNAGILWRKNQVNLDPDYRSTGYPQPLSVSLGVNLVL